MATNEQRPDGDIKELEEEQLEQVAGGAPAATVYTARCNACNWSSVHSTYNEAYAAASFHTSNNPLGHDWFILVGSGG